MPTFFFQQYNILPTYLGQVIRHAASNDSAADDNDFCLFGIVSSQLPLLLDLRSIFSTPVL
jgi:hypothetical protein